MKKILVLLLVFLFCFTLPTCDGSTPVEDVESLIDAIGDVTPNSKVAISAAETAFALLSEEDKAAVSNHDVLIAAQNSLMQALYVDFSQYISGAKTLRENTAPQAPVDAENIGSDSTVIASPIARGSCGETTNWIVDKSGTLTICGIGEIPDNENTSIDPPWMPYIDIINTVVIGDGITRIGDRAFQSSNSLVRAIIGKDVTSIGEWAFQNCYALATVQMGPNIEIETGAFRNTLAEWDVGIGETSAYQNSDYYRALTEVALTGDYREDIVNVALSQLGYHEGNSESDYTGENTDGKEDYTEYGRRLQSVGTAWCSEFASWCIRSAGVPVETVATSCTANVSYFTRGTSAAYYTWDQTVYGGGAYTPRKGDIFLWAWDDEIHNTEENLSHTSIFLEADRQENGNLILKTVDGNRDNRVQRCEFEVVSETGTLVNRVGRLYYIIAPDYENGIG